MIRSFIALCICLFAITSHTVAQSHIHDHILEINIDVKEVNQSILSSSKAVDGKARFNIGLPAGNVQFVATPNSLMSEEFKQLHPEINTYDLTTDAGQYRGRLTINETQLYMTMHGPNGIMHISPGDQEGKYIVEDNLHRILPEHHESISCGNNHHFYAETAKIDNYKPAPINSKFVNTLEYGDIERTYRMAIVCTGEYYQANGNNPTLVRTQITSTVSALEEVYYNDLSIRYTLLTPKLFSDPNNDPFTPDELPGADARPTQADAAVNADFNEPDYDIGHVLHETGTDDDWSGGGVARLRSVCRDGAKAFGWSGSFNTRTLSFVFLFAHEIGHMFGAEHTFNGDESNCTDAISETTAYEIASGTTIMSYNGICGADWNIPLNGDTAEEDHFHVHSLTQMINHIDNFSVCPGTSPTNNAIPDVDADPCGIGEYEVPRSTPYFITGNATDADMADVLSYSWEQYDEDGSGTPTQGFIGNQAANNRDAPQIRNRAPMPTGRRYIPSQDNVLNNIIDPFEVNSNVQRDINLRLVVRDNAGAFGVDDFLVKTSGSGPFRVAFPAGNENLIAGDPLEIRWTTGGSDDLCDLVDIKLSLDGGISFPFTIAEGVNYGDLSYNYTIPPGLTRTDKARVMISCADNDCIQFYSLSRLDFSIDSECIAQTSSLCDTTGVTANAGAPELNLNISAVVGNLVDGAIFTQVTNISQQLPLAVLNPDETGCAVIINNRRSSSTFIEVGDDGEYFFDMEYDFQGNFSFVSVFREDLFDANNICASFVGSTVRQSSAGGTSVSRFVSSRMPLEACVTYRIVAYSFDMGTVNIRLNGISGSGLVFTDQAPDPDYSYSYLAVNKATGVIAAHHPTGDFTTLVAGNYEVYGFSYKSGGMTPPQILDLNTIVGKSIFDVAADGDCIKQSDDFMRVDIETSCFISDISPGMQGDCNPADNTYSQELIITYELPPAGSRLTVNGESFDLMTSPQTITLTELPSDGNPVTVNAFFEDDPFCGTEIADLFTAPDNCCPIDIPFNATSVACQGEPLILDAGADGMTYDWFLDGAPLSNVNATLNATSVGTYQVIVTTGSGCAKSAETVVSFEDNPTLSMVDDATICDTESYDFTLTTNADSITILLGGAVNQINPANYSVTTAGVYSIVANSDNGCETTEAFELMTEASPVADLGLDVQACTGDMIMLDAGVDGAAYVWTRNGMSISNNARLLDVTQDGQYIVSVTNMAMCTGTDTVEVSFTDNPTIEFTNADARLCTGGSLALEVNSSATDIVWTLNGSPFTPTSTSLHEADLPGEYMVVASFGPSCQAETSITVTEIDQPSFDLPEDMIVSCIGSEVVQMIETTADTYEWLRDGMFFSDQQEITITQAGTYTASAANGGICFDTDVVVVDFVDGPTVQLDGEDSYCTGGNTILTVTTNGSSIQWLLNGTTIPGETDNTLVVAQEGQYQVQISGTANCVAESTLEVTENPLPEVELGDDRTICLGEMVELNADTGNIGDTYSWTKDGLAFSMNPVVSIDESGIYELTIENSFECSQSDALSITVLNPPTLSIAAPPSICEGDTEVISVTSNATDFTWSLDGNLLSGETGNSITINAGGTYTVVAGSAGLCSIEDAVTVDNISLPIVELGDNTDLCPGQNLSLSAGNHTTYLWSDNSTNPTLQVMNDNVATATTESYGVTVTNMSGCENEDEITVTLLPIVMAEIDAPADGVCQDGTLTLTATGGTTYQWTGPAGTIDDPSAAVIEVSPTALSTYSVVVSDACPGNEDMSSIELEVFMAADVTAGPDTCIVIGQEYAMQASGGAFYSWDNTGTIIGSNNIPNAIVSPESTTTYTVEVTDENGCTYSDEVDICVIEDPLEIFKAVNVITPNDDGKNDALIFPGLEAFPDNNLAVFNRWGNLIFEKRGYQINGELWDGTEGGETLPPDVYYYILDFGGFTIKSSITLLQD